MFPRLLKDIDTYARRSERFSKDFPQDSKYLDYLGMVCMLGTDIYIKKQMININQVTLNLINCYFKIQKNLSD